MYLKFKINNIHPQTKTQSIAALEYVRKIRTNNIDNQSTTEKSIFFLFIAVNNHVNNNKKYHIANGLSSIH